MEKLRHIAVNSAEENSRNNYCQPRIADAGQQRAEDSTAEHHFLGNGCKDADDKESERMGHDCAEHCYRLVGHIRRYEFL